MGNPYRQLQNLEPSEVKLMFDMYYNFLLGSSDKEVRKLLVSKFIHWNDSPKGLNVLQIRFNDLFVTNNILRNNDWMVTVEGNTKVEAYRVTVDPKIRRNRIFNVRSQITLRHIGYHHWNRNRICLRQDYSREYDYRTWGRRYIKRNGIWTWYDVLGNCTIHTHDNGGFWNSSLGCTIIANMSTYKKYFKPALIRVKEGGQGHYIPMAIIPYEKANGVIGFDEIFKKVTGKELIT